MYYRQLPVVLRNHKTALSVVLICMYLKCVIIPWKRQIYVELLAPGDRHMWDCLLLETDLCGAAYS